MPLGTAQALLESPLVDLYIKGMGLDRNQFKPLILLYQLRKFFSETNSLSIAYANFLLNQICRVTGKLSATPRNIASS